MTFQIRPLTFGCAIGIGFGSGLASGLASATGALSVIPIATKTTTATYKKLNKYLAISMK
jgi:hypothetical protein